MENSKNAGALTPEILKKFRKNLESDPKNLLAVSACSKTDPLEVCLQRHIVESSTHVYTHKVDSEVKPFTNQKNSGRCWVFATLNVLRIPFVKQHQIEDFEFSQTYLFFWDKVERCNFVLHNIVSVLQRGESIDGRLLSFLLHDPIGDGGQWDMVVNLIERYGVIPKKCFPESFCSETSARMNSIIKTKIREYTKDLHLMVQNKSSQEKINEKILVFLEELYRIITICLGIPPETFTWEYYNKSKAYCVVGPITPLKFYEEYVKPYSDVENKILFEGEHTALCKCLLNETLAGAPEFTPLPIDHLPSISGQMKCHTMKAKHLIVCLVNDPRPDNPYGQTYTIDCLGNVVGGRSVKYLNQKTKDLLQYAAESIKNNEAVWFGCEVGKRYSYKLGIQDLRIHDYKLLFGVDINKSMSKAERLIYGDTAMNHAMAFTAVSLNSNGEPTKWRVENSWGDDKADKGFMMMTTEWFEEFGFEVVVDKKYVPKEVLELIKLEPKVLPAWDPMGTLAL